MAEVKNAEEATERALSFLRSKYPIRGAVARPMRAVKSDGVWLVELDVGIVKVLVATIKIDASSGDIVEYSIPPL